MRWRVIDEVNIHKIPLGDWIDSLVDWITVTFAGLFSFLTSAIEGTLDTLVGVLSVGPAIVLIIILALLVTYTSRWPLGIFTILSLLLIYNLGYWESTIQTLAIVIISGLITILIGIPVGIWCAQRKTVQKIVMPILDFMQTMPAFVYLIPSILFFGIGVVPGIIASFIFAIAPTIRMTNLGIQEVPKDLIEAADAFGSTSNQKLFKVQMPLATPTILAGVNQSIMLALSMVVTASLVGAPGLGADVYRAVSQINVGQGFEAGLSIVFIAIILDRITQNIRKPAYEHIVSRKIILSILTLLVVVTAIVLVFSKDNKGNENANGIGAQTDYQIIGIEPGAGLMKLTREAMKDYGLDKWKLIEGSSAAMVAELKKAYSKKEPIIVTGWSPHWMFSSFDLKYLDDPKGSFGGPEDIHTLVRKGLEQDAPGAYKILDQFSWKTSDMEAVMVDVSDGTDPAEAAEKWIEANQDKVAKWTNGAQAGNGESIKLVYVAWDTEIASTNVIGKVLEKNGYDVTLSQVEVGPMFAGIANGSADAMVAAWLPSTHLEYYNTYKKDLVDLGPNLHGTKNGLVVPKYVEIDSIEDLK
jgi:glycine betaine/proline transport system substrate-binding protein